MLLKKVFIYLLLSGFAFTKAYGSVFDSLMVKGKAEFKKEYDSAQYASAVNYLTKAVQLIPNNVEAHYFLAYALDRSVSKGGEFIIQSNATNTLEASKHLELVNKITPRYNGEIVVLDPYSKLSAIWGSLAMKYEYTGQRDSVLWALSEGARRGGFRTFFKGYAKLLLDECAPNSILISSGDNITFHLKYLQAMESYRNDVTIIDAGLLYTQWYPRMLSKKSIVSLGSLEVLMDSVNYLEWQPTKIDIPYRNTGKEVAWIVKPSIDKYLTRGNFLLLSILQANEFNREVYLAGLPKEDLLDLDEKIQFSGLQYKIVPEITHHALSATLLQSLRLSLDGNSIDEEQMIKSIRWSALFMVDLLLQENQEIAARKLFSEIELRLPKKRLLYGEQDGMLYNQIREKIKH